MKPDCTAHGFASLPAASDAVAFYLTDLAASRKTSTMIRRTSAISQAHQITGFEIPYQIGKGASVPAVEERV
jgi:hypothetical protein